MRLTVLQATKPDAQQLIDLEKLYLPQGLSQQQLQDTLEQLPNGTTAWTARFNDRHQAAALLKVEQSVATVSAFTVRDFNRRRGIGTYLLQELMRYAVTEGATTVVCNLNELPDGEQAGFAAFLRHQGFSAQDNATFSKPVS